MDTKKLRQKILDLAIHGKLVPQDPNDEPASVLLERIRAEKEKLIKEGKIKAPMKSKSTGDTSHYPKDVPFEVPEGWVWSTLGEYFNLQAGKFISADDIHEESSHYPYRCFGGNGIRGYVATFNRTGDYPIIGRQGALCGNINYASGEFYATEHAVVVESFGGTNTLWARYLLEQLNLNQYATATAQPGLSVKTINEVAIPIPPIGEQQRIAEAINRCIDIINYIRLSSEELQAKVHQAKSHILNLAIHGKLVSQDPSEEPAIELLKRINPAFQPSHNLHYEGVIPDGWQICKLSDLFKVTMGQSPDGTSLNRSTGIEFHQGKICFTEKYLSESDIFTTSATKCAEPNSLLCCVRAPVGVFNITSRRICIGRGLCSLSPLDADVDIEYWFYALSSLTEYYESMATGSTFKAISGDIIRNTVIAVPPRMEQKRIFDQITRLFSVLKEFSDTI